MDLGILVLYLCFAKQMKKQYYLLIHSAFFDIVLQQKVRQVGLSETPTHRVGLYFTLFGSMVCSAGGGALRLGAICEKPHSTT